MNVPTQVGSGIKISGVTKEFAAGRSRKDVTVALDDVSLEVEDGEFLVLLGPSGCGKSTLLRCIAGLEQPQRGSISIGDIVIFDAEKGINLSPDRRPMSMIFQSYALWPHMTAAENAGYPLKCQKVPRDIIDKSVSEMLDRVGIGELKDRLPAEMSGGQQQRLALARALISGARAVVFDEPLSNVDAVVRERLRLELSRMQRSLGFTAIYVTHDQDEAMHLADRIAVMVDGRIRQMGAPRDMYMRPKDVQVARFLGSSNELKVTVEAGSNGSLVGDSAIGPIRCKWLDHERPAPSPGAVVSVFGRPLDFYIQEGSQSQAAPTHPNTWQGTIETARFLGTYVEYVVSVGADRIRVWQPVASTATPLDEGNTVVVGIDENSLLAVGEG